MSFGSAVNFLKIGRRVSRVGWNGKGMYIFLIRSEDWSYKKNGVDGYPLRDFIAMKTADNQIVPWLASQTDMLANDWVTVWSPPGDSYNEGHEEAR
ncbi:MAG: DUF2829 domain-containing protein [Patescibacteria group bacterium]|nr:DUF2829 domain-containing protein [Patescibacteria group bacterium]